MRREGSARSRQKAEQGRWIPGHLFGRGLFVCSHRWRSVARSDRSAHSVAAETPDASGSRSIRSCCLSRAQSKSTKPDRSTGFMSFCYVDDKEHKVR
ncbi:hypothetical protein BKA80DRAFT_62894 [Phyllosticta citrichinensis]